MAKVELKKPVVEEIANSINGAASVVLVSYKGITVEQDTKMRKELREAGVTYKVYKNTLAKRAVDSLNIGLGDYLEGPSAISFSSDELAPVKVISEFAKNHNALELKAGIVEGKVVAANELAAYAAIPSREGLLTMLAGGMMQYVKDLAIGLNLYAEQLEGKE